MAVREETPDGYAWLISAVTDLMMKMVYDTFS